MNGLFQIRMELARTDGFPEGSRDHGYVFVVPLSEDGYIDSERWSAVKEKCFVNRFWGDEPIQHGMLRRVGRGWRFDYDANTDEDDEPFFKLDRHALEPGNYVSVTEQDGIQRPFRIVSIEPVDSHEKTL